MGVSQLQPWQLLESTSVFQALPWIQVFRHTLQLPDGRKVDDYHSIDLGIHVCICAFTQEGRILMLRHYRHGCGGVCLGLPAGAIHPGEPPLQAAQRELLEETGYAAPSWTLLGCFREHGNYGCGDAHLFRADGAVPVGEPDSGDLEEMELELMTASEVAQALRAGQIPLLGTVAALALAQVDITG